MDLSSTNSHRKSLLRKSNRRSTFVFKPHDQDEPPSGNPSNTSEVNEELKKEYETLQLLNKALDSTITNFDETRNKILEFSKTVDDTEKLLDVWLNILEKTEKTKQLIEDPEYGRKSK
ncbi:hypothetical protein BDB01DRAFT_851684 [Pilobolus umbonatus]|nr:hypothetical protein BDB01DRAFT_851684 [Pilobolus umbonatus]